MTISTFATAQDARVGVLMPTSGTAAKSGQETLAAVRLAVDIINNKYDIDLPLARTEGLPNHGGAKIQMFTEDHGGRPERGRAIAERMITQDKVHILQGAFHSSVASPSSQVAEKMGIPYVTGTSESPALTARGFKTFFSVTPTANDIARDFFSFLSEVSKEKGVSLNKVSVIHVNDVWGTGLAKAAIAIYKNYGFTDFSEIAYPPTIADMKSEILKLKSANPDVLLQASFDADAILAVRTYQALKFEPKAILAMGASFASPTFIEALGKNADYNFSHTKFHSDLIKTRPAVGQVNDEYQKRTGKPIWDAPARAFTGMMVVADILNRAKSFAPEDILAAARATNIKGADTIMPYRGVRFNDKGQNELANGLITQIQGGTHYPVWPKAIASKDAVFPAPGWDKR
jgi:branched-chain amino acid transport system substrate-binding protein